MLVVSLQDRQEMVPMWLEETSQQSLEGMVVGGNGWVTKRQPRGTSISARRTLQYLICMACTLEAYRY